MLTKSDYLRYLECPIHLWIHRHRSHEVGHHIDPQLQWIFEQGDRVEAYARSLFPEAEMVSGHSQKSEERVCLQNDGIFSDDSPSSAALGRYETQW